MSSEEKLPSWREIPIAGVTYKPSTEYKTGDWKVYKPVINYEKCTKCMFCYTYCPDGAIKIREDGFPEPDYDFCKGCGICAEECPVKAIEMVKD